MIVQICQRGGDNQSYRLGHKERIVTTGIADMVCLQSEDENGNVVSVTLEPRDIDAVRDIIKLRDKLVVVK